MSKQEILKRELELQIFNNTNSNGKLIQLFLVTKDTTEFKLKAVFGKGKEENTSEEDKNRILCFSIKSKTVQIVYVKKSKNGAFEVIKIWQAHEIKSIEDCADEMTIIVGIGKSYKWTVESDNKKFDMLWTLTKITRENAKPAKLINFEESKIKSKVTFDITPYLVGNSNDRLEKKVVETKQTADQQIVKEQKETDFNFNEILNDLDWNASGDATALENKLRDEITSLETANIHAIIASEEASDSVLAQIESALLELDQIDEWLTHYTYLLDRMGQDVHQVELQNKDMQIASENQKILLTQLNSLMGSLRLPGSVIETLKNEPLEQADGVKQCVIALNKLMGLVKMDYKEMSQMAAVQERIDFYQAHATQFGKRLSEHLEHYFKVQNEAYSSDKNRLARKGYAKIWNQESKENKLFEFIPLLNWLKEYEESRHSDVLLAYLIEFSKTYKREVLEFIEVLKTHQMARKETILENQSFLFQVHSANIGTAAAQAIKTAMKGNIQHSSALSAVEGFKSGLKDVFKKKNKINDSEMTREGIEEDDASLKGAGSNPNLREDEDRLPPDQIMILAFLKVLNCMIREQNFILDLFTFYPTPTSLSESEWKESLTSKRETIKEAKLQNRINEITEKMFADVSDKMNQLFDAAVKYDASISVVIMAQTETHIVELSNTCYNLALNMMETMNRKACSLYEKFVEDQIKGIEETRVTAKRRRGILSFISIFPSYVDRMESFLGVTNPKTRKILDKSYNRIIKVMFETLELVASQVDQEPKTGSDEKEIVNVQIMTVENMHHFYSRIRARKVMGLDNHVKQAKATYDLNLETYCKVAIKKPLGKLHDFFEGVEGLLKTRPAEEVSYHLQYSKNTAKDVIKRYPGKEIKKGLENLYKRVHRHYTEEEGLLQVVWRGIQEEFCKQIRRYDELIGKCYPESNIRLEFTLEELLGYFSELAASH